MYDVADTASEKGGSFLNLQGQSVGERYDESKPCPGGLTMVQDTFKPGSHVNNAERLGSSWVSAPELAAAHAASEGFGTGEKLVVGKDGELEVDRDQRPDTPVWHGPSRPL